MLYNHISNGNDLNLYHYEILYKYISNGNDLIFHHYQRNNRKFFFSGCASPISSRQRTRIS